MAGELRAWPTWLALSLAPSDPVHAAVATVPRVQGPDSPPGQTIQEGSVMTEAAVSFAGNLTEDPELRHTEAGIARAMVRVRCWAVGSRRRRSSP